MQNQKDNRIDQVLVIGAGASGMMAAITAARAGARVRVLEKQKKPGRKLLLTGNGRCNLSNLDPQLPSSYHSNALAETVLSSFSVSDTLHFFEELGLMTQERNGYVYPRSGQSQSVLNVLLAELDRLHVQMKYNTEVTGLEYDRSSSLWEVKTDGWTYLAKAVVLSGGSDAGLPSGETGAKGSSPAAGRALPGAWRLARQLGHTVTAPWPALTAMHIADPDLKLCDGARSPARVTLFSGSVLRELETFPGTPLTKRGGYPACGLLPESLCTKRNAARTETKLRESGPQAAFIASDEGELQWTASELSGIPVFQLSRYAYGLSEKNPMVLGVDFFPEYEESKLKDRILALLENGQETQLQNAADVRSLAALLGGFVHDRVASYAAKKVSDAALSGESNEKKAALLAAILKRLALTADGTRGIARAQICLGGTDPSEVDPETLESAIRPGLFMAGEMLDIDGPCGGYNLQWAWSSGNAAGRGAAEYIEKH